MQLDIYTDGGSRGNPGPAGIGIVALQQEKVVHEFAQAIGVATNNEAEYKAILQSATWVQDFAIENKLTEINWFLDSKLVVEQLLKNWKIKEPRMKIFAEQFWKITDNIACSHTITHIPRAKNSMADALVNQALDAAQE